MKEKWKERFVEAKKDIAAGDRSKESGTKPNEP